MEYSTKALTAALVSMLIIGLVVGCGGGGGSTPKPSGGNKTFGAMLPTVAQVKSSPKAINFGSSAGSSYDLTTTGYLPPVGNQGQVGSCVAWAIGYGLCSYEVSHAQNLSPSAPQYQTSPEDVYTHVLELENQQCLAGTNPTDAFAYLTQYGAQTFANVPYNAQGCNAPSSNGGPFGLNGYESLFEADGTTPDDAAIKQSISQGHPVAIAIQVPSDFQAWGGTTGTQSGIYNTQASLTGDGHALLVVGFNDGTQAYHIQNSWGTSWGNQGLFWMSYSTFDSIVKQAYVSTAATNIPPVNPTSSVSMQISAVEYLYEGYYFIVFPFQLSEPLYVSALSSTAPDGSSTGSIPIGVWTYNNYVWFVQSQPGVQWLTGTYTVSFQGQTRDGRSVTVSASSGLTNGNAAMRAPKGTTHLMQSLNLGRSSSMSSAGFVPGAKMLANGVPFTVPAKP